MLGTFNVFGIGNWVVSGDDLADFLWDLFDLMVMHGDVTTHVGGLSVVVPDQEGPGDSGERQAFRHTPAWESCHSDYFLSLLLEGSVIVPGGIHFAAESFFSLHAARLVGAVNDRLFSDAHNNRINRVALYKYGVGTPEYMAVLKAKKYHDYPYQDLAPEHVISYLLLKGALSLTSREGAEGVVTDEEVRAWQAAQAQERQALIDEEKALIQQSMTRRRSRKRAT